MSAIDSPSPAIPTPVDTTTVEEFAEANITNVGYDKYAAQLITAWSSIGESAESQKAYIGEISSSIRALLDSAVAGANQRKIDIQDIIERKTENVANIKAELADAVEDMANFAQMPAGDLSLIDRLREVENIEVKVITERQQWIDKLEGLLNRATGMCEHLGLGMDEKFQTIGALSPVREAAFTAYIGFLTETQTERKQVIADSVASIMEYWKVLESVPTTHLEKSIADKSCDLGVHIEVIEALQQMKADLDVEYVRPAASVVRPRAHTHTHTHTHPHPHMK